MATLEGHSGPITCLAISEKEGAIFSGSFDKTIKVWESRRGSHLWTMRTHSSPIHAICCADNGRVFSASTRLHAFDASSLIHYRVIISAQLPNPYFTLEKRVLPWILFQIAIVIKVSTLDQLASYAIRRKAAMPKRWVPPTEALDRFADLGFQIDDALDFKRVYISVILFVLGFLSLTLIAGPLYNEVWIDPTNPMKYVFLALGFAFKFITGACFLPCMKILMWPLAAWEEDGPMILAGTISACCLLCAKLRLARIDTDLTRLRMKPNIFDWSNDRIAPEAGDETSAGPQAFARTEQHPLSMRSPRYDMIYAVLGLLSMLNSLFCARLPDHGIATASIQLILGLLIFCAGYYYEPYFSPASGAWDQNRLQNGMDASLLAIYTSALIATIAAKYCTEEVLNSMWLVCSPLLTLPAAYLGFNLRRISILRREPPSTQIYTPLIEDEVC